MTANRNTSRAWHRLSYTIRRRGCTAWADGIKTLKAARIEQRRANRGIAPGHRIYAEERHHGDPSRTRTIEVGD